MTSRRRSSIVLRGIAAGVAEFAAFVALTWIGRAVMQGSIGRPSHFIFLTAGTIAVLVGTVLAGIEAVRLALAAGVARLGPFTQQLVPSTSTQPGLRVIFQRSPDEQQTEAEKRLTDLITAQRTAIEHLTEAIAAQQAASATQAEALERLENDLIRSTRELEQVRTESARFYAIAGEHPVRIVSGICLLVLGTAAILVGTIVPL